MNLLFSFVRGDKKEFEVPCAHKAFIGARRCNHTRVTAAFIMHLIRTHDASFNTHSPPSQASERVSAWCRRQCVPVPN